jgi:biuret amidohydrolase
VIPATRSLQQAFRVRGIDVIHARIACLLEDGRDRSLSQRKPGWNYLLLPRDAEESQIVAELAPHPGEIVVTKTTDSALTGTNLRLMLANMGIRNVVLTGIFTDQCVSSTVRSLADESFNVIVVEDCCAAGTEELHRRELEIINMIYCHVVSSAELREILRL